jgi:phospholipid/cholesterol/gamma-HCH transport system substrate-binding protein
MPSAKRVRWATVRIACVILAGITILFTQIYLLTEGRIFSALFHLLTGRGLEQTVKLYLYVPDASGLNFGSPVRADGVSVGKVARIQLTSSPQPDRVIRLTLAIDRDALTRISADSNAQLSAESLVGDMFVDISSGTSPRHLQPGSVIPYQAQPELLKTLDLQQFDAALRSVDATLTDIEQGKSRVGQFVIGTGFYDDLRSDLKDIERAVRKAASVTGAVGQPLYTDTLYQRVREPILGLDRSLAAIQAGQGSMGTLLRDDAQYEHFRALAQNLRASIASMRSAELLRSDSLYRNLSTSLAGFIRSIDDFNTSPMVLNSSAYDGLNGMAQGIRDSARQFHSNPKAYVWMKLF